VASGGGRVWWTGHTVGYLDAGNQPHTVLQKGLIGSTLTVSGDGEEMCDAAGDTSRCVTAAGAEREITPRRDAGISSIRFAPDGALWFAENGKDRIGWIDRQGTVHETLLPPAFAPPLAVLPERNGSLSFSWHQGVNGIDASALFAGEARVPFGHELVRGPDGSLWMVIDSAFRSDHLLPALARIQPDGMLSKRNFAPLTMLHSLTFDRDGALWFAETHYRLPHLDPSFALTRYSPDGTLDQFTPTSWVSGIAMDGFGTIWIAVGGSLARVEK